MATPSIVPRLVQHHQPLQIPDLHTLSYDDVLELLALIESDSFDERYSSEEIDQINQFIATLALEGVTKDERNEMESAVASLLQSNDIHYAIYSGSSQDFVLCKNIVARAWDKTVSFVIKHKKAIIIGAAIVVAATVAVVSVGTLSGCAIAAGGVIASNATSDKSITTLQDQITTFKETVVQEQFAAISDSNEISLEENGRIVGSLFAHQTIDALATKFAQNRSFSDELKDFGYLPPKWLQTYPETSFIMPHPSADLAFSTNYTATYAFKNYDLNLASYQARGNLALSSGYFTQAVHDFGQAITLNPTNPFFHLERGFANFELGHYEDSFHDYMQFVEKKTSWIDASVDLANFSVGLAKGVPSGVYHSGESNLLFLADFITHPVQTSKQIIESLTQLASLVKNDQCEMIAQALSPELHMLVTKWDNLSPTERGELTGFALGKLGTDLIVPGAISKIANKSIDSARELAAICKNFQFAQETLVLETAAGIGVPAKLSEIIELGKKTAILKKEHGFNGIQSLNSGLTVYQEGKFLSSIKKMYDENLTQLSHAFSKHAGRYPQRWNRLQGAMNTWHDQALRQLMQIYNAPGEFTKVFDAVTGLTWIEKRLPDGRGIRLNQDYTFKVFLD